MTNHLEALRHEALLSGCCPKCGSRFWERSGYLSDACRKCDTDCFGFVKELPPRPLALACRWALEHIAELEAKLGANDQPSCLRCGRFVEDAGNDYCGVCVASLKPTAKRSTQYILSAVLNKTAAPEPTP